MKSSVRSLECLFSSGILVGQHLPSTVFLEGINPSLGQSVTHSPILQKTDMIKSALYNRNKI